MPEELPENKYTVMVIPHTHWDREWYATFQQFRIRLVHVMDELLELLERNPAYTHFNLDGQTVVLQDYLEIRPEKGDLLGKLVKGGRLGVGPWYVLPDEFLVSGEALVRNLLFGHRVAGSFGHVQKVGYLPDTFGHISQLPQILQGFDIPYAMHFRGLDEGNLKSDLWWQSPDGSRVLLRHLPTDMGYGNASALAKDLPTAGADLLALARYETRRAVTSVLLALNGVDHLPARPDLPEILAEANRTAAGRFTFRQVSLEEFFAELASALTGKKLQTVCGELRDANRTPGRDNRLLPHILSSRIYNKQQNQRAQNLLEHWAEPFSALAWLDGADYPSAFLWKAWEWLLQNHPHDSIGGCSVDAVHSQMETRFAWSTEIADEITRERFDLFARHVDLSGLEKDEAAIFVFNALPWKQDGGITVDIDLWDFFLQRVALSRWKPPTTSEENPSDGPQVFRQRVHEQWYDNAPSLPDASFRGLHLRRLEGTDEIPVQVESIDRSSVIRPWISGPASERRGARIRASFHAELPACGYQAFAVRPLDRPSKPVSLISSSNVLENEYLSIEIAANGTFCLTDKTTRQTYPGLGYFEDGGDCGDGYNYSYPLEDRLETSLGCSTRIMRISSGPVVQRSRVEYEWSIPEGLDGKRRRRSQTRIDCPLSVTFTLAQGSPRLELEIEFENRARDHRLRVLFPTGIVTNASFASAQFDVVSHPIHVPPVPQAAWVEDAPTTFPQQDWVDLSDGVNGLCVITRGLPEYEVLDTERREVAVTLLRAVAYLGAGRELQTAAIGAGPNISTPEAQIQRKLTFSLALFPHRGTWGQAEVWRQALQFNNPARAYTTAMDSQERQRKVPPGEARQPTRSLLALEGKNVILSALKKAEDGEALILRLYNPSDVPVQAVVTLPFTPRQISMAGLDEKPRKDGVNPEWDPDGSVHVAVPARKIITLRIDKS